MEYYGNWITITINNNDNNNKQLIITTTTTTLKVKMKMKLDSRHPKINSNSKSNSHCTIEYYVPATINKLHNITTLELERHDPFVVYNHCYPLK